MPARLKVMWDYFAFPLWREDTGVGVRPALPDDLVDELQRWSDAWTWAMSGDNGPDAPDWVQPDAASFQRHNTDGRALADRVQAALPGVEVSYMADDAEASS